MRKTDQNNIYKLNSLLLEGIEIKESFLKEYRLSHVRFIYVFTHYSKAKKDLAAWKNKVEKIMEKNIPQAHYITHFKKPKVDIKRLTDVTSDFVTDHYSKIEAHTEALRTIIWKLDENENYSFRKSDKEKKLQENILYEITFNEHTRILKLNNIQLSNPNTDSKAMNFFEYVYQRPNKIIDVIEIEEASGMGLTNNIQDILRDLKFLGTVRKVFFPIATKQKVKFINPITKKYASVNDLPTIDFTKITRQNEN